MTNQLRKQYRVAIANLGCRVNRYEADAVAQQFRAAGFLIVPFNSEADVYIVNSCAVTGEAARKSGQFLRRARRRADAGKALVVGMGCLTALEGAHKDADFSVGSKGKSDLCARVIKLLLEREQATAGTSTEGMEKASPDHGKMPCEAKSADLPDLQGDSNGQHEPEGALNGSRFGHFEEFGPVTEQSERRAFVKIQDGCNQFCSYCTIPLARGRVCSREPEAVLQEVQALAAAGYEEITLTGIHVCSYGLDFGRDSLALMDLCDDIAKINGIRRIRFGSVEPLSISPAFIQRFAANPKLCRHLHLSMQSGSDPVLRAMRRNYTSEQFAAVADGLRAAMPGFQLTTDVICAFPGETEQNHLETLAFCRRIAFSHMHVFRFAARPRTRAYLMKNRVPDALSERRSQELLALSACLHKEALASRHGRLAEILLEQAHEAAQDEAVAFGLIPGEKIWQGYEGGYLQVLIPERLLAADQMAEGRIVRVRLVADNGDVLLGKPL